MIGPAPCSGARCNLWRALLEALNDADVAIDHTINASGLITLTAATAELRAFVLSATIDPEAFPGREASGPGFELSRLSNRTW